MILIVQSCLSWVAIYFMSFDIFASFPHGDVTWYTMNNSLKCKSSFSAVNYYSNCYLTLDVFSSCASWFSDSVVSFIGFTWIVFRESSCKQPASHQILTTKVQVLLARKGEVQWIQLLLLPLRRGQSLAAEFLLSARHRACSVGPPPSSSVSGSMDVTWLHVRQPPHWDSCQDSMRVQSDVPDGPLWKCYLLMVNTYVDMLAGHNQVGRPPEQAPLQWVKLINTKSRLVAFLVGVHEFQGGENDRNLRVQKRPKNILAWGGSWGLGQKWVQDGLGGEPLSEEKKNLFLSPRCTTWGYHHRGKKIREEGKGPSPVEYVVGGSPPWHSCSGIELLCAPILALPLPHHAGLHAGDNLTDTMWCGVLSPSPQQYLAQASAWGWTPVPKPRHVWEVPLR